MKISGAYRVYRIWGGGAFLVFSERAQHQLWLATCRSNKLADGVEVINDPAGQTWIPIGDLSS